MRLRVKTSTGKSAVLTGIEQETTADNFRKLLHESVDEHPEADMRILVGFPPKQFSLKGDTQLGNAVQDGDVVVVDAGVCEDKKKRPKRRRRATFEEQVDFLEQSRQDISHRLADAADRPEAGLDALSQSFKTSLQAARIQRAAETTGEWRYRSALAGDYQCEFLAPLDLQVKFKVERKWVTEKYMFLPKELLKTLVATIYADEQSRKNLRPYNMAVVSPRVFWNVVHSYGPEVDAALREMAPQLDWSYLESRERAQSEKGKASAEYQERDRGDRKDCKEPKRKRK